MPQATATWDTALLGCPEARDYAVTQGSLHRQGAPIEGALRLRRVQEEGVMSVGLRVHQTEAQYEAFRSFYFDDLNAGEDWFLLSAAIGLTPAVLVCNIVDGFTQERNATIPDRYLLNFTVDAFRKVSTPYVPTPSVTIAPGGPDNPNLATLDVIDPGGPDNPNLGTLDVIDPNPLVGLPS